MNISISTKAPRTAALLFLALQGVFAFACAPALAVTIENTATIDYHNGPASSGAPVGDPIVVVSNTDSFDTLPTPTPAAVEFLRHAPGTPDSTPLPVDGGQCRVSTDQTTPETFVPMPELVNEDGNPLDLDTADGSVAEGFYLGEPVLVRLEDGNRNRDAQAREFVEATITTSTGDEETLRLQETGVDTGVFAIAIQSLAMPPAPVLGDCMLSLDADETLTVTYGDPDFPSDTVSLTAVSYAPAAQQVMLMTKQVSVAVAAAGDFVQYRLSLENRHDKAIRNVVVTDTLPPGMRYQAGSLRIDDQPASDPTISADGRRLSIDIGELALDATVELTYLVQLGSNIQAGQAINRAMAEGRGRLVSNEAQVALRIEEPLFTSHFTIIGRVLEGECGVPAEGLSGVANVRLLLDDGTYVTTDQDGAYHFEGVRPGTHVVQMDLTTLPAHLEAVPCNRNTRFAGRAFSQFVEANGGSLWRADFRLREKAVATGEVGLRLQATATDDGLQYTATLDGGAVAITHLRALLMLPDGLRYVPGSSTVDGIAVADPELAGNVATFDLGDTGSNWQRVLQLSLVKNGACPTSGYVGKAVALLDAGDATGLRTPPAENVMACSATARIATASVESSLLDVETHKSSEFEAAGQSSKLDSTRTAAAADRGRQSVVVQASAVVVEDSPFAEQERARNAIGDDTTVAEDGDWLTGQTAGNDILFPGKDYNPASPTQRVVIKHAPKQKIVLTVNGETVSPLSFDGVTISADKTIAISIWSGVPLIDGDNLLQAQILDKNGAVIASLSRTVHYANKVARAVLVPEESILVADGIHKPVIAVRMLDRSGHPVRAGVSGAFELGAPYLPAQTVQAQQQRQLAGLGGFKPTWYIEGDNGVAYIELAPTSVAGSAQLRFRFQDNNGGAERVDELRVWLESTPRDWIVVGFASGTVGYDTLKGNMQTLADQGAEGGLYTDGQLSLYAKGRVAGEWMLTLAYDSDKPTDRLHRQNLLSTIDPDKFYTLYGDTTQQGYDASSVDKLYLKLERDQFYALFGDYVTGLDRAELSRYNRTLNGIKVEYRGPVVEFNGFAAQTAQQFARDEIRGNGTSGLYRLSQGNIAINGETVRIETRDRYRNEIIIESRTLTRHIDYDIDYSAGTLFFREPINSRDFDFNPIFIVVEYETLGDGQKYLTAGGRVGMTLLDGRLNAGLTHLSDDSGQGRTHLTGIDARLKIGASTELRVEAATSEGNVGAQEHSGNAWLVELEHHGQRLDALAYVRRQDAGFGLNQQNAGESGMYKIGVDAQWRINDDFSLQGQVWHQEDLVGGAVRDAANLQLEYHNERWGARAGVQLVRDRAKTGEMTESRQLTLGANRSFLDNKLELNAAAEIGLGGKNESVDFPTRLQIGASYAINDAVRLIAAQEFTDGDERDTATTRFGFEVAPWQGARLTSTLNQSQISEYGPRTFGLFGLNQKFQIGERWGVDLSLDSSHAFNESGNAPPLVPPTAGPVAPGGIRDGGALTEDFTALSAGATYRSELWSWNGRVEGRDGDTSDRYGFTTAFLRQIDTGMAFAASAQAFSVEQTGGSRGLLANVSLSWAWRPLGSQWSLLNRLELRVDELRNGSGDSVIGQDTLAVTGDAKSRRLINNFVINHVSDEWTQEDMQGNLFEAGQRSQWSLYYGSKYVFDRYDERDYSGYTDILGLEWRYDLTPKLDIGLRGSVRHAWNQHNYSYAFGPVVGFSPFTNAWFSVGYNVVGFEDRDFDAAHYTRQGAYLMLRFKFDQQTPLLADTLGAIGGAP